MRRPFAAFESARIREICGSDSPFVHNLVALAEDDDARLPFFGLCLFEHGEVHDGQQVARLAKVRSDAGERSVD